MIKIWFLIFGKRQEVSNQYIQMFRRTLILILVHALDTTLWRKYSRHFSLCKQFLSPASVQYFDIHNCVLGSWVQSLFLPRINNKSEWILHKKWKPVRNNQRFRGPNSIAFCGQVLWNYSQAILNKKQQGPSIWN